MIRLTLDTADIERLLRGKTVIKHKSMHGTGRAMMQVQGALNRIIDGDGREL